MQADGFIIGVDLGATNMLIAIVDADGRILHRDHRRTEGERGFDHVVANVADGIEDICVDASIDRTAIQAVGVAVAGAVDVETGVVLDAFNLGWKDEPFRDRLAARLGCPVAIDNDVNAAAWGEHQLGAGRGHADLFAVWVGTGIGGGLVLNHALYHGAMSTAGEIGQSVSDPFGEEDRRVVEDFAGRAGMKRLFADHFTRDSSSMMHERCQGDASHIDTDALREAYHANDPLARTVIDHGAERLGVALANVVSVLSLSVIVLGGGLTEAFGQTYIDQVKTAFDRAVFPPQAKRCAFVMTALEADAGVLGAALLARALLTSNQYGSLTN
ncbi:MAG: ROK family protein [Planctomycetota bacterium]